MHTVFSAAAILGACVGLAAPQTPSGPATSVPLTVSAGAPLRLYLVRRLPKRVGAPARAKLIEPLYAFDREVVPAGAEVTGRVARLDGSSAMTRVVSGLNGDFTPLHRAYVEFTTLTLPDGRQIAIHTARSLPLNSMYTPPRPKKQKKAKQPKPGQKDKSANSGHSTGGVLGTGKQTVRDRINGTINARTRGVADLVHAPDRRQRLEQFLISKLPYHPQWIWKGTRIDAELSEPLTFGSATLKPEALADLGTQPPEDSVCHARLLTPVSSATAHKGEPIVAVVSEPVFSNDHHLILPAGTRLSGAVTQARRARWFHRGGQLRFSFQRVDLPPGLDRPVLQPTRQQQSPQLRTQAMLQAAESGGRTQIKVDDEGGVKATEPKKRLLAPVLAAMIATHSADNDAGRHHRTTGSYDGNAGARTLGGASGFGLLGAAAGRTSRTAASALGYYGLAWSVYSTVIARGGEVEFGDNAAMDIRFGARPPAQGGRLGRHLRAGGHAPTAGPGAL